MPKTPEEYAQVEIANNAYRFKGNFHVIEPNQPIRNQKGQLCGITNPRDMTYVHSYGAEWIFFDGIGKGKIHATRCDNKACETKGSIYLPFRIYCPDCLHKATVIDVTSQVKETATVHSFMTTERTGAFNTLRKPIRFVNVEFQGVCTILMSYLPVGEPKMGMRIVPIFRTKKPTYTITDLAFVPLGTKENQLPEGFTF